METKKIFITGDIANDYFLIRGNRFYSDDQNTAHRGTHYAWRKGGAHIIFEFLKEIAKSRIPEADFEQMRIEFGFNEDIFKSLPEKNSSFVSVNQFEKDRKRIWRVDEFLGYGDPGNQTTDLVQYHVRAIPDTNMLIIDDAGIDFTAINNKPILDSLIESITNGWKDIPQALIIYKKSGGFKNNNLIKYLLHISGQDQLNLITILSIQDIRNLDVKVSAGLSWEQSALDLVAEFKANDVLSSLLKSKYLVVTFQSSGALLVINDGQGNFEYTLIFDPEKMEGEDEDESQGKMIGRLSVFTAAFAAHLDLTKRGKNYLIGDAVKAGLTAIRLFYENGYIPGEGGINYPFEAVVEGLKKTREFAFSSASVPGSGANPGDQSREWSVLLDNYSENKKKEGIEIKALTALAKNIVLKGPAILKNIPSGRFGNLFTIDRSEIESLRNLKKIMETYVNRDEGKKPLSIAVFGPPGAGKSFAVEEIGKGIMGTKFHMIVFNLSQFSDTNDLIGALHQVRDCVLRKKIPIVFWDEFDSQSYKWLQYLLAPMQDGAFQEGQITHPVGKCIFVFAGGTSYNMHSFGKFNTEEAGKDFILKKGPDFISRLNGYINILGPNRRQQFNPDYLKEDEKWKDDPTDLTYSIRRAIFIIGLLRLKNSDFPFKMDWGLLNALIKVDRYKHGSRSLANLLNDIRQNNPQNLLLRSWLPSKPTLELYFKDADSFYKYLVIENDFLEMAWEIAPLIHSYWMKKINDPANEYAVEYCFLPVFIKESNMEAVRRIPRVLGTGGFKITRKNDSNKLDEKAYLSIINEANQVLLEDMAEKEHELWMEFYEANGWEYSEIRNDYIKKHNCMVPYSQLPESEKLKDREVISNYPAIVEKAGFGIVKE